MDEKFAQFSGTIPENYDLGLGPIIFADFGRDLARRVADLRPRRVLELAAGTGIVTRLIRDALDAATDGPADQAGGDTCDLVATDLTATDLNPPMLDVSRCKFRKDERITFRQADATDLPFNDGSFDVVICQFGVMFFPDKDASYCEAHRVLEQGGSYVFSVWRSFAENPFARVAQATAEGFFDGEPPGFYHLPFSYHDEAEIRTSLENAGFSNVTLEDKRIEKVVEDFDLFSRGLVFGNPLVDEIKSKGNIDPEVVRSAIAEALRKEFGDEPSTMPLHEIVVTASRP